MDKPIKVSDVSKFKNETEIFQTVDQYESMLGELFLVQNPGMKMRLDAKDEYGKFRTAHLGGGDISEVGEWFFFPWSKTLVHFLPDALHQEIRTARNKNIITKEEQEQLYDAIVAIAGLSVGSHGATTIAMMGIAKRIKLADMDEISASNLNRLHSDFTKIGRNKAEVTAEFIYQMNPYASVEVFSEGLSDENLGEFLGDVDVIVEEMDGLPMKVKIRKEAKKLGIPVVMATDNGNSVILDVEQFDTDPDYPLFHGKINFSENMISANARQTNPKAWNKIASEIIGIDIMEERLLTSLPFIGQTLGGVPQLGAAATISGGLLAICVAKILTGKPLPSGKYDLSTEAVLTPGYKSKEAIEQRKDTSNQFRKFL